jgi:6,7-dimethyl-8-ribityllumazine synthase
MLKKIQTKRIRADGGSYAIVASRYNTRYVDAMVRAARAELKRAGAKRVELVRVPGAYDIPVIAAQLAGRCVVRATRNTQHARFSAIICLGVILRGETVHAAHIGDAVSRALMQIQLNHGVPVIHEVLLLENEQQARARCLSKTHNRGTEAAQTALAMARAMAKVSGRRR